MNNPKRDIYKVELESDATPVNCVVSAWSEWSVCSGGYRTRTRTIITPASDGGTACPVLTETEACEGSLFSLTATANGGTAGKGTVDLVGADPFEVINLSFEISPGYDENFNSLAFTVPLSVGSLEPLHLTRNGTITADASGNATSVYEYFPGSSQLGTLTTMKIISRSSGKTFGVGNEEII